MKKVLVLSSLFALGAAASFGSVAPPPACSTQSVATIAEGYTCEIGDKIFSNINTDGAPTTGTISFNGSGTLYTLDFNNFSAPITTAFTFSFNVAVDTITNPSNRIIQVQDQMLTSNTTGASLPNNTTAVVTHTPGGIVNLSGASPDGHTQNGVANMLTTNEGVSFAFTPGANGQLADVSFIISQTTVPEPVSLSLTGLGLLVLGFFGRRRLKS
jgi:hypothetical protein